MPDLRGDDRVDSVGAAVGRRVPILCDGETELLLASMECLGSDTRRTLSDPNEGGPCLDGDAALARFEIRLSDADLAMLDDCRGTACSTDEIITGARVARHLSLIA